MMRQLVGAGIELRVGQLLSANTTATASGVRAACASNSSGTRRRRDRPRGVVPRRAGSYGAPPPTECRAAQSHAPAPQPPPPAAVSAVPPAPQHSPRSNRSLAYSMTPSIPAGVPSAARCSPRLERQVELGAAASDRFKVGRSARADQSSPAHCSATPASPGTADAATASAQG